MSNDLRLLDPVVDLDLFRESFGWRPSPKRHIGTNRMSFESFCDPAKIVIGWFDSDLQAVFVFEEFEARRMECHFTSRRNVSRNLLLHAADTVVKLLLANGVVELVAWIKPKNRPLCQFVSELGFTFQDEQLFNNQLFNRYILRSWSE